MPVLNLSTKWAAWSGRPQNLSGLPRERGSPIPAGKQMTVSLSSSP